MKTKAWAVPGGEAKITFSCPSARLLGPVWCVLAAQCVPSVLPNAGPCLLQPEAQACGKAAAELLVESTLKLCQELFFSLKANCSRFILSIFAVYSHSPGFLLI